MTKKKAREEPLRVDPLEILRADIEKKWGKGIMVSASAILDLPQKVISAGPSLDMALSGGIPQGSWVSISGPPKVGKTVTFLSFAAACQKVGMRVHYFNIEMRLKEKNLRGILGLDRDPARFVLYQSRPELILSGKDHLEMAIHVLQTDPGCLVILDSVSALVESAVLEEGLGTQTRGGGAKMVSQFIDIVAAVVPVQNSIVCGVTHLIADTSGRTQGKVEKAANRWLYQADVRLKASWASPWCVGGVRNKDSGESEGGREIGKIVHWFCQESALGPPGIRCDGRIRYGVGVDGIYEIMEMARAASLLVPSGSWYEFTFLDEPDKPKVQGAEKAYALLAAHPDWVELLKTKVLDFLRAA